MSHYCNKHSQSPIRYKNGGSSQKQQPPTSSSQKGEPTKINIKVDYTSPFSESTQKRVGATPNNLRGQQTESTHADLSPLLQQKLSQLQYPPPPFQFQNYVSIEGVPLRPQEIDQMKLRQEIAAREHELKLLAQMDYLLDLIKNIDQDRNINIDAQKIEEIEKLKSDYQSINDDIQNLSFSQNMNPTEENPKRASRYNNDFLPQTDEANPIGYQSVGQNQPIQQEVPYQYQQQQQQSLQNSLRSSNNPQNMVSSQRSNAPLQQSVRSNQSNRQQQIPTDIQTPQQQDHINSNTNASLLASTQEQLFYQQNNIVPDNQLQNQYNQGEIPYDSQEGLNQSGQSQKQSLQNSINQSKKNDLAKELVGSGVPSYSQQLANILVSSQHSQHQIPDRYDQIYQSNQSNNSSRQQQPMKTSSQHTLPQQNPDNFNSQPMNYGSLNQGVLTGSYSLKNSQRGQQPNSQQQLYQSNPQLYQSSSHQPQVISQAQQKLEQSIQTSLQLINSISKVPTINKDQQSEKNQLEQQIHLYEKQIKELLEENDCLKKNIADSQIYKKPLVTAETKELYSSVASKASRTSFTQPTTTLNGKDQPENQIIQELEEAIREKEADLQILIQNITTEKDQNRYLVEENEILKTRLQNVEREAFEMQQQRQRLPTFEQKPEQGLEAYSSVEGSNFDSKPREDSFAPKNESRRESEFDGLKQGVNSKRLSELESEQKEVSVNYQEEIARLNKLLQSVKDELGYQQALHVEYTSRFNKEKTNQLIRKYEDLIENEQIKNMLSSDMQDSLASAVQEQEVQIEDLKMQLANQKDEYELREKQLIEFHQQNYAETAAKNESLEQNIENMRIQNQDQIDQIAYLDQEMQQIKQRYIEIEMKKDNLLLENGELKTRIDQLEEVRNQEIGMKEDAIKHINELQTLLEQKNQEIDALNQQKEAIQAEYDELLKSLTEMESNLQQVQVNFNYNKSQHELLKRETREIKQFLAQKGPVEDEEDEIHQSIKELKKELNIQDEEVVQQDDQEEDDYRKNSKHPNEVQNQNDLHHSHSSKHSHHHSSLHSSARFMKDSQTSKNKHGQQQQQCDPQNELKQSQPIYNYGEDNQDNGEYNEQEEFACDDCDMCMLEELQRQNEQLKQQLLLKEKEIIELKTNPAYYAKTQAQINQLGKIPYSNGKGQIYLETNDQVYNTRVSESPIARQNQGPNSFISPQPLRTQLEQQQQRMSLSNSKQSENQFSSSQKQQQQQQQQGGMQSNYQSYSVLQSEIEHLQKIFDQKCKEVDSWKKTYQQFYEQ